MLVATTEGRGAVPVELVHWNPVRRVGLRRRPLNNFGDLIGPMVCRELLRLKGITGEGASQRRLLSVGSILMLARDGDVIWGTGMNGKSLAQTPPFSHLDIRAVRGPLTREFLMSKGHEVPKVYGDPALLLGTLWGRERLRGDQRSRSLAIIPNFHDLSAHRFTRQVVDPRRPLASVLAQIAASDFVVGSSLHAVIVAESLGIPARAIASAVEPAFKYEDYYRATGRSDVTIASSLAEALALGGERAPVWDAEPLLAAFPYDLWADSSD